MSLDLAPLALAAAFVVAQAPPSATPSAAPGSTAAPATGAPAAASAAPRASGAPATPASSALPDLHAAMQTSFYRVETDKIVRKGNGDFRMPDKVAFARPGSDGTADSATGNDKRGTVTLVGNVVVHDNGNAPEGGGTDEYARGGPATLTCDRLDVDEKAQVYDAAGHVHYVQGTRTMDADRARLDRTTGLLHLDGNVRATDGESVLRAAVVDYNTITKKTDVRGGPGKPLVIKEPIPSPGPSSAKATPAPKKRRIPIPF